MSGYWKRPKITSEVIDCNGWFATGDIAIVEPDGYLRIVDRKKDMIIVSGFNVYPNELEEVLTAHPDVVECAAIGVPSVISGEEIRMFVVRGESELTSRGITRVRTRVTLFNVSSYFVLLIELTSTRVRTRV